MVALRVEDDNPAYSDPIYAAAHQPKNIVMFEQRLTETGEVTTIRVEKEVEPNSAVLKIDYRPLKQRATRE